MAAAHGTIVLINELVGASPLATPGQEVNVVVHLVSYDAATDIAWGEDPKSSPKGAGSGTSNVVRLQIQTGLLDTKRLRLGTTMAFIGQMVDDGSVPTIRARACTPMETLDYNLYVGALHARRAFIADQGQGHA